MFDKLILQSKPDFREDLIPLIIISQKARPEMDTKVING